ncbi:hypothetical protein Bpfe_001776, partial [Biomphalaria pfeifferi]
FSGEQSQCVVKEICEVQSTSSHRSPVKHTDWTKTPIRSREWCKMLVLLAGLCHVIPCQSCRDNPLGRYEVVIKKLHAKFPGRDVATILTMLLDTNPAVIEPILTEWKRYTNCIGLVDTGYFKRSELSRPEEFSRSKPNDRKDNNDATEAHQQLTRTLEEKEGAPGVQLLQILMTVSTEI